MSKRAKEASLKDEPEDGTEPSLSELPDLTKAARNWLTALGEDL
jgi:hypothetical protein